MKTLFFTMQMTCWTEGEIVLEDFFYSHVSSFIWDKLGIQTKKI